MYEVCLFTLVSEQTRKHMVFLNQFQETVIVYCLTAASSQHCVDACNRRDCSIRVNILTMQLIKEQLLYCATISDITLYVCSFMNITDLVKLV